MSETKYTSDQVEVLKRSDPFFEKAATEKYAIYKSIDPYPEVKEALLNSVDLFMYLLKVGIVEPFDVNKIKGITYQCTFSGEAHYYDSETSGMKEIVLDDDGELMLEPNSITYLKIEEKFHVPEYMALRFNLSVSNAYKGLLLGTGPIVDPGFEGNLYIPLHNLTGNKYIIKKDAPLIRVEFTKLSPHIDWKNRRKNLFPTLRPITKRTPQNAEFSHFIQDALLDPKEKKFHTSRDVVSVRSSIPDLISVSAKKADEAHKSALDAESNAKRMKNLSFAGALGVCVAIITLVYTLLYNTNTRYDNIMQEIKNYISQISELEQQVEALQKRIDQYEMVQPLSTKQQSGNDVSAEGDVTFPTTEEGYVSNEP